MTKKFVKELLDKEIIARNVAGEVSEEKPDPILIAHKYRDEYVSLACALFAYGKATLIVKFLRTIDFSIIDASETVIREKLSDHYYRFQKSEDVIQFFIALRRLKKQESLEDIFLTGYEQSHNVMHGISKIIEAIQEVNPYSSQGYKFLISRPYLDKKETSTFKRYNMFLRWMVREDNIDMGLWQRVDKKDLLIPLDTHIFKQSKKLGLLKRKNADFKSVIEITESLKKLDITDPIKYDFAIYRLGQEKILK